MISYIKKYRNTIPPRLLKSYPMRKYRDLKFPKIKAIYILAAFSFEEKKKPKEIFVVNLVFIKKKF